MKKLYKLLFMIVLFFGLFAISTSYVSAEEVVGEETPIPDITEEVPNNEPSELALWIEENIVEVVVGIVTGLSSLAILLFTLFKNVKKFINLLKKERDDVNLEIKDIVKELRENKELYQKVLDAFSDLIEQLKETKEETKLANNTFTELKTTQEITKEMLRIGLSNDKELVRTGVAEEINKLAKKGV